MSGLRAGGVAGGFEELPGYAKGIRRDIWTLAPATISSKFGLASAWHP
jgi:hypothetical protein